MTLFEYQNEAVKKLFEIVDEGLDVCEVRQKRGRGLNTKTIHFISPTGSGKTVMSFALMDELVQERDNLVFVWIAPNTLHTQSLDKFNKLTDMVSSQLNPIDSDGIESNNILNTNDILCLNWSSLDKENNILIKENESGKYIDNIINLTKDDGKIIIALIDESHIASQNDTTKAYEFLKRLNPAIKIEITATPKKIQSDEKVVEIDKQDVIDAGVIKKQFIFNAFNDHQVDNRKLVEFAYKKLQEITQKYYEYTNGKIIPLMIIQIENEKADDYNRVKHEIERYLFDIGIKQADIAYYLSNDKERSEDLAKNDNPIQIVFTKTAIATGWDCPRASVLLTFRKSNNDKFKTQVLGRINRMPELKHYGEELLDSAYVFANASRYIPDDPSTKYAVKSKKEVEEETVALKDEAKEKFSLPLITKELVISSYYNSEYDMNTFVVKKCEKYANEVYLNYSDITNGIIRNLKLENLMEIPITPDNANYILEPNEVTKIISSTFRQNGFNRISERSIKQPTLFDSEIDLTPFETEHLLRILKEALSEAANQKLTFLETYKIVLQEGNYEKFVKMLSDIKNESLKKRLAKISKEVLFDEMKNEAVSWKPLKSFMCDKKNLINIKNKNIYSKNCMNDFNKTERAFVSLLETMPNVLYWYRNGSKGKDYFRIPYKKDNIIREFYPDFIVMYNDNKIGIYDTKSEMTANNKEAKDKAEFLYAYCNQYGFKNGLIKIDKIGNVYYFQINERENYTNYDKNNVEWENFGTLVEEKNIF